MPKPYTWGRSTPGWGRLTNLIPNNWCYRYDSDANDSINFGTILAMGSNDFALECWISTIDTTYTSVWGRHIIGCHEQLYYGGYAVVYNKDSNTGKLTFKGASTTDYLWDVTSDTVICDGVLHHIFVTRDVSDTATGVKIYIDGVLDKTGANVAGSCNPPTAKNFAIGADSANGQNVVAKLGNARVYDFGAGGLPTDANMLEYVAWSAQHPTQIHPLMRPACKLWVRGQDIRDNVSAVSFDYSGNGNNGIKTNTTLSLFNSIWR